MLHCNRCDDVICDPYIAEHDGGELLCGDCVEGRDKENGSASSEHQTDRLADVDCGKCGKPAFTRKSEGLRCWNCAHELEVELLANTYGGVHGQQFAQV